MINIHPIFVHFPIALFSVYTFFEVLRFPFLTRQAWYFYVKAVLVIAGSLASFVTAATGLMAQKFMEGHPALEYHEFFALLTAVVFVVVALSYALSWYAREKAASGVILESWLVKLTQWIVNGKAVILLAVLGFITLTITGGLGGVMVYGTEADPFFKPVYNLLVGQ
ncbi:MAG: hypothetical protein HYZ51_01235 [Candidatus Doudnabacteria bacterium]|nr:hypothetical protein [Candidatus Doudnabacteria bacterium]